MTAGSARHPLKVLFASGGDDPFIAGIERWLSDALQAAGGQCLVLAYDRDDCTPAGPWIDLWEVGAVEGPDLPPQAPFPPELVPLAADTRWYHRVCGHPDDPASVERPLAETAWCCDRVLETYRPDVVLVWNGLLSHEAVVADRARRRGVPVRYCEKGPLPDSWYADPLGVNAAGSLVAAPRSPGLMEALDAPLEQDQFAALIGEIERNAQAGASAWGQPPLRGAAAWRRDLGIPDRGRVLFFPLQVDADTNMRFFSPHFSGSLEALRSVVEAAGDDWFVLAKPHPKGACPANAVEDVVGRRGRCVPELNLHDALDLSGLVVTVNSTVAAEAAWRDVPVLQLGRGILSDKGIVAEYRPGEPLAGQLAAAVAQWREQPQRRRRALQFYRYLSREYLLPAAKPPDLRRVLGDVQAAAVASTPSAGADAAAVASGFMWRCGRRLLDALSRRHRPPRRVLLLGWGRNARRMLRQSDRHPFGRRLCWQVWDDNEVVRRAAAEAGWETADPFDGRRRAADTLVVITPRASDGPAARLAAAGLVEGRDYVRLDAPQTAGHPET